jgi:hypothetical protein
MSTQMQLRGGTTAETLLFTGAQREVTVDTDKNTIVVHDGVTPGGFTVASEAQVADSTYFYVDNTGGGSAANAYILIPQSNTNQPNSYQNGIVLGFVTANANTGASTANFQGLGVKNIKYRGGIDPSAGDIFGRITVIYDSANDWLELQRKPATPLSQIRPVSAAVSGNALTVALDPVVIDFRSPSLSNATINSRTMTASVSLVAPIGATLGTVSGVQSQIAIIAIDNAGTVELAMINLAGGAVLDETTLISTQAISAASTSAQVFYSQSARAGVPYRVMGMVQSTQPAAGTWTSPPSKIQGQGGQAFFGLNSGYLSVIDSKPNGTAGGGITLGAFRTRDLNTIEINEIPGASLSANQVTLPAGTYIADISTALFFAGDARIRLQNITAGTTVFEGVNAVGLGTGTLATPILVMNRKFTLAATSVLELQIRSAVTRLTDGLGLAASLGTSEIYSRITFRRV